MEEGRPLGQIVQDTFFPAFLPRTPPLFSFLTSRKDAPGVRASARRVVAMCAAPGSGAATMQRRA